MNFLRCTGPFALVILGLVACGNANDDGSAQPGQNTTSASTGGGGDGGDGATGGGAGGSGGADACTALSSKFQKALDDGRASAKSPGAMMGVITPDCGLFIGASGTSTKTDPMNATDVYRIGSVTKTFVASTTLELAQEGVLGLDDALEKWAPGFPNGSGITLRQLLNHTSGIYNYTEDDTAFAEVTLADPKKVWTPQELVDIAAAHDPYFAPGSGWHYSNTDYIMLGMVIETATADGVAAEIRTRFLEPQNLTSTSFDGEEPIVGQLAHGYSMTGLDVSTYFDPSVAWAAGAMVSSVGDLAHWATALYSGSILDAGTMAEMLTTVDTTQPGVHYGLGVFVIDPSVGLTTLHGHGGDIFGYHNDMFYLPAEKSAFVTMVNSDAASQNDIDVNILEILVSR